ncbi:MAG: hypothetical protein K2X47_12660 [Bdellovibrionales bacterium]|nr:hypothetical protein [Bdellovibrionales bacterium]
MERGLGTFREVLCCMDLKKVILIIGLIAGAMSLINHFVGGLKFSGFRHTRMMRTGMDRDMKIAGGKWHMERTERADVEDEALAPAEMPAPEVSPVVEAVPTTPEEAAKKPGYNFQTSVKAMPMPVAQADAKDAKKNKKKKKKKKTEIARKSTNQAAPLIEETPSEPKATNRPTGSLNPNTVRQLSDFLQTQQSPQGGASADQVYAQLFQFGGNLQSIAKLFQLYQNKQIESAVFFTVIERILLSPNIQFRIFAVQGLKNVLKAETFERLGALMGIETDPSVIANIGSVMSMYATPQNIQLVAASLKSVNPSARYHALTTIRAAMQATGSQSTVSQVSSRDSRGGTPPNSGAATVLTVTQKFQTLAASVREMQSTESEKRIASLANEVYYSILQFVQSRRVAGT